MPSLEAYSDMPIYNAVMYAFFFLFHYFFGTSVKHFLRMTKMAIIV